MNASKNSIILISIGATAAIGIGVCGVLAFNALSRKGESVESLEMAIESARKFQRAEIAPTKEAIAAVDSNRLMIAEWADEAFAAAAEGDMAFDAEMNEAAFKQMLVDEARELAKLPGGVSGAIVAEGFTFGFKDYISGGVMPKREQLPALQRQWSDISLIVKTLSDCGAVEVTKIAASAEGKPVEKAEAKPGAKKRQAKKAAVEPANKVDVVAYELEFRSRPAALARAFNAFADMPRFITVDQFSFAREADMIAASLDGDKSKPAAATSRRRRRAAAEDEEKKESTSVKKGLVVDPGEESPFLVRMKLVTYDFSSKAEPADGEVSE